MERTNSVHGTGCHAAINKEADGYVATRNPWEPEEQGAWPRSQEADPRLLRPRLPCHSRTPSAPDLHFRPSPPTTLPAPNDGPQHAVLDHGVLVTSCFSPTYSKYTAAPSSSGFHGTPCPACLRPPCSAVLSQSFLNVSIWQGTRPTSPPPPLCPGVTLHKPEVATLALNRAPLYSSRAALSKRNARATTAHVTK